MTKAVLWSIACLILLELCPSAFAAERPRRVVVTDMTHNDDNSHIRLLHYANEIDIEAIIVTPQEPDKKWDSAARWKRTQQILDAYAEVYENLKRHDPAYPTPQYLERVAKRGHGALPIIWLTKGQRADDWFGEGKLPNGQPKDSEGSDFLVEVMERPDPRPMYVGLWGGPIAFTQALYRLRTRHNDDELQKIMDKLQVYSIHAQDITMDYYFDIQRWQASGGARIRDFAWTPCRGPRLAPGPCQLLVDMSYFWFYIGESQAIVDRVHGHGPLSDLYDRGGEGDTPAFLGLISGNLGLNDPWDATLGSWGGRFAPLKGDAQPNVLASCGELKRWSADVRASFLARLQYTVEPPEKVNHPPRPVLNGDATTNVLRLNVQPGEACALDAAGTSNPDGDSLGIRWWVYKEAGTYPGDVALSDSRSQTVRATVPADLGRPDAPRDPGGPRQRLARPGGLSPHCSISQPLSRLFPR